MNLALSFLYSKMPDQTSDHLTPATRLLEKRREMAEVEHALSTQKEVSCNEIENTQYIIVHVYIIILLL